jgi:alkylhydroperoxidase family enzyme
MADAAVGLSQAVYQETTLSYREAEGARMRIAQINGCLLCKKFRLADDLEDLVRRSGSGEAPNALGRRGEPPTEKFYEAVAGWRDSDEFSARERLAIEYAERIAQAPIDLPHDDPFWQRLRAGFDDGEIVDLTYSITTWIATGRFVHVLGLDGACEIRPAERVA